MPAPSEASGAVAVGEPVAFSGRSVAAGAQPAGRLDVRAATGTAAAQSAPGSAPRARSPRRAPKTRRPVGAAAGPAQRANESSGRAPNRTRTAGTPTTPAQRGGGDTPATPGDTAAAGRQTPIAMLANAALPRQSAPSALSDGPRADGVPSAAPTAAAPHVAAAPQFAAGASAVGCHAGNAVPVTPVATPAPEPALGVSPDGGPPSASAGATAHTTRDSVHCPANFATAPHSCGCSAPRLATRRRTLLLSRSALRAPAAPIPICCRSTTCCRSPRGRPGAVQSPVIVFCSSPNAPRPRTGSAAGGPDVVPPRALLPRHSTPLADGLQVAR